MKSAQLQGTATPTIYNAKRLLQYAAKEIDHCEHSQSIKQYIYAKRIQAKILLSPTRQDAGIFVVHIQKIRQDRS
jgi:hypothetical protein